MASPPPPPPQPAIGQNINKAHLDPLPPSVFTLPQTAQLEALYTIIRNKDTSRGDFLFYSDRIIRLLVEEGLNHLPVVAKTVETPTVSTFPVGGGLTAMSWHRYGRLGVDHYSRPV